MKSVVTGAMLLVFASACSSQEHGRPRALAQQDGGKDAASDSAPSDSGKTDATADATADADAADAVADSAPGDAEAGPIVCNSLSIDGPAVGVTVQSGNPPPATGGTIVAGKYWLTERDVYGGGNGSTDTVRRTLVIGATTISLAERTEGGDGGATAELRAEFTYTLATNGALNTVEVCPAPGAVDGAFYTATTTELWLFPSSETREVYKLQ